MSDCAYCTRGMACGIYDFGICMSCRARWYLNQPKRMHGGIAKIWRQTMPPAEVEEVTQQIKAWNAVTAAA